MLAGGVIEKGGKARGYKSGCVREKCCFKAGYVNERGRGAKPFRNQVYREFLIKGDPYK